MIAATALLAWLYLAFGHGRFWLTSERLGDDDPDPASWPDVVAVVPARDEARFIERAIGSLLRQSYPGRFDVILVDDESRDGTAERAARVADPQGRLTIRRTPPRPPGWVGKMWAVHTGVEVARSLRPGGSYLLLTDADVAHGPGNLRRLVRRAERDRLDLASLMVELDAKGGWAALLVPAFVYFFCQLYPFPWVNDPRSRTAGAAGGCMLVRRTALDRIGGIATLRGEVIDDCALARAIKPGGPIWLGLSTTDQSLRPYADLGEIWSMVARSAYTQLRHSLVLALGTLVGLGLLFVVPPVALAGGLLAGKTELALLGLAGWAVMSITFLPTVHLYHRGPTASLWALCLPLAGVLYGAMTLDSVRRHRSGRGAEWKGRFGAGAAEQEDIRT